MAFIESLSNFNSQLVATFGWDGECRAAARKRIAAAAAIITKLRDFAPYAVIVLPGGSLVALLWWAYRRQVTRGRTRSER